MSVILRNANFVDWKTLNFTNTNILFEEGIGGGLKFFDNFHDITISSNDEILDCSGKLVTKSFANGHHHAYSALARGMPAPKKNPTNFLETLEYIWWNIDKSLDKEMIEACAYATAIASAKAGSTFVIDHHASPNYITGSLQIIANAFDRVGVSHLLCYEITDRDGLDKAQQGLDETEQYLKNHQGLVGLHASFTVGNDTLKKSVDLMQKSNSGIHIHVAEDQSDEQHCLENHHTWVVDRLKDYGVLNSSKTILAHCLHLDEYERNMISDSPVFVVQNAESNQNNNVGYFNADGLGDNIMFGTDGMHSDMIRSAQSAFFVGQDKDNINFASAYSRFRNVHKYLSVNNFDGDSDNNIVVMDYDSPTGINENNFLGHFIFGLSSNHVNHVISNGKIIVKSKIIQSVNEKEILEFTKEQANRLWKKL